ncbi:MAG TPA: hypothetical protein VFJ28_12045 [Marmoricola sp.]|nr:hypothetical protein [Marmoricola sp.]
MSADDVLLPGCERDGPLVLAARPVLGDKHGQCFQPTVVMRHPGLRRA